MAAIRMDTEAVEIFVAREDGKMGQADGGAVNLCSSEFNVY